MLGFMRRVDLYKYTGTDRELVSSDVTRNFPPQYWEQYKIERELRQEYHINKDSVSDGSLWMQVWYYDPDDDTYNSPDKPWRYFSFSFDENTEKEKDISWISTKSLGDVAVDGYGCVVYSTMGEGTNYRTVHPYRASKYGGWDNCSGRYKPAYLARLMREGKAMWS